MRSRKPDTRATIFTWRELSVCATNTGVYGIDFGSTASTLTSGAGRGGGGASLPHPVAIEIATDASHAARAKGVGRSEASAVRVRRSIMGESLGERGGHAAHRELYARAIHRGAADYGALAVRSSASEPAMRAVANSPPCDRVRRLDAHRASDTIRRKSNREVSGHSAAKTVVLTWR